MSGGSAGAALTDRAERRPRVAILQTSLLFVAPDSIVKSLFGELLPDAELLDLVDGDLLATVQHDGGVSPASVRRFCRLAESAVDAGADVLFSACSSLGPAADVARRLVDRPLVKIDDAMAREAVRLGSRIGVVATVPTTLAPTSELIAAAARAAGREVAIEPALCEGAFRALGAGDRAAHDTQVKVAASELAARVDVVVLAQASMSRLEREIAREAGIPVLSSPRLGVADVARILAGTEVAGSAPAFEAVPAGEATAR